MQYHQVEDEILKVCKDKELSFLEKGKHLEELVNECNLNDFIDHLLYAGIIPESVEHDSTEEKVYAKYCDALLARALKELGYKASIIDARSDSADVKADSQNYSLVGDAKAFRLSRTAKNQKDFKVEALNQWRKKANANYALLLAPIYQYPSSSSQIYSQARRYNVTLLSYTHMAYLIKYRDGINDDLKQLWTVSDNINDENLSDAKVYWNAVSNTIINITGTTKSDWDEIKKLTLNNLSSQVDKQIEFWENQKRIIMKYSQQKAVKELIKSLKIDNKIQIMMKFKSIDKIE